VFYEINRVPTHSVLQLSTRSMAVNYPRGDIRLGCCQRCGFIFNLDFEAALQEYEAEYESTQSYSPTFSEFSRRLAADLVARYNLQHKKIIEIGCGMGEFLTLLCEMGDNQGLGFDPAYEPGRVTSSAEVHFVKDFYGDQYAHHSADFWVCKMTLEHISTVGEFVGLIATALEHSPETILFFQVPDVTRILHEVAFWDIYYEHCSYFSAGALLGLFKRYGFSILSLRRAYGGQYLMIEARMGGGENSLEIESDLANHTQDVQNFATQIEPRLQAWKLYFEALRGQHKKTVLWGAGSKAVAFLSTLNTADPIEFCVDINPLKQHHFMAGSGQEIISPEFLKTYQPNLVIAMNPIYKKEIHKTLQELGVTAELITVNEIPQRSFRIEV